MSKKTLLWIILGSFLLVFVWNATQQFRYRTGMGSSLVPSSMMKRQAGTAGAGRMGLTTTDSVAPMLDQSNTGLNEAMPEKARLMPPTPGGEGFTPGVTRTIVKNANLSLLVKDTRKTVTDITELATTQQGYVTSANIFESESERGLIRADLVLRVPVDKLDGILTQIRALAQKISYENLTADDRTEQKIDLEAQLKNLRATETQLQAIMKQATTVTETLEVQQQLTSVRNQIERLQAQLDNLSGEAAMATITITISTKESELPVGGEQTNSLKDELKLALRQTVAFYRQMGVSALKLSIFFLPVGILLAVGYLLLKPKLGSPKK